MQVKTTVDRFTRVLSQAGANNYYRCEPNKDDPNLVVLSMPKVRGQRENLLVVLSFTLTSTNGERTVYFHEDNPLAREWYKSLTGQEWDIGVLENAEGVSQAHA